MVKRQTSKIKRQTKIVNGHELQNVELQIIGRNPLIIYAEYKQRNRKTNILLDNNYAYFISLKGDQKNFQQITINQTL